jgi:hypothetical protein
MKILDVTSFKCPIEVKAIAWRLPETMIDCNVYYVFFTTMHPRLLALLLKFIKQMYYEDGCLLGCSTV